MENLRNVVWIEGIESGTFPIGDVVDRVITLRSAPLTVIFARVYLSRMERVHFDYEKWNNSLLLMGEGQAGKGG